MKPVNFPLSYGQKIKEVFVQLFWVPISVAFSFLTFSPISLLVWLFHSDYRSKLADRIGWEAVLAQTTFFDELVNIWPYFILLCWLPFVLVKNLIMPKFKNFTAIPGSTYNVGESDTIKEVNYKREIRDSMGTLVGYVDDVKYEVKHDDGVRHEASVEEFGLIIYCLLALPLRCISLFLSIFALFIPSLFICIRKPADFRTNFWHSVLDILYAKGVFVLTSEKKSVTRITGIVKIGRKNRYSIGPDSYGNNVYRFKKTIFPERIFEGNTSLTSVTTPRDTHEIQSRAFANCSFLHSVCITCCLSCTIDEFAFLNCSYLQLFSIQCAQPTDHFPNIEIRPGAFEGCSPLRKASLPLSDRRLTLGRVCVVFDPRQENGTKYFVPDEILSDAYLVASLLKGTYKNYIWKYVPLYEAENLPEVPLPSDK